MTQVTVKHLWKEYGNQIVLENVNLQIDDHEFVTIVGASGCGKTTFLKMLLGIETPSRGQFLIDGTQLPGEPGPDRGIVFQRYSLFPHLTVLDNLLMGLELRGAPLLGRLFGALDPGITGDMHRLILKLWNTHKMTIFMVTHDLKESFELGTRLLVFDKVRTDPQAPEAYGATITYNIPLNGHRT